MTGEATDANTTDDGDTPEELDGHPLTGAADPIDFRDFRYQPALVQLRDLMPPPTNLMVRNQGNEGACTGFALAAVIATPLAYRHLGRQPPRDTTNAQPEMFPPAGESVELDPRGPE